MTHESWKERVEELLALSGRLPVPPRGVGRAVQLVPVRPALARDGRVVHELPKDRRSRVLGAPADSGVLFCLGVKRKIVSNPHRQEAHMDAATFDAMTPLQRLIVERALILAKELEATAGSAPTGQIIDRCESLLLGNGREFLRRSLEDTLQSRVDALEKKGRLAGPAPVA